MKVYVQNQRVTIVGKGWQVKAIIKQYMKKHKTIQEWVNESKIR